jgi:hypothetical protein
MVPYRRVSEFDRILKTWSVGSQYTNGYEELINFPNLMGHNNFTHIAGSVKGIVFAGLFITWTPSHWPSFEYKHEELSHTSA